MSAVKRQVCEGEMQETKKCHLLCHSWLGTVELGMEGRRDRWMDGGRGEADKWSGNEREQLLCYSWPPPTLSQPGHDNWLALLPGSDGPPVSTGRGQQLVEVDLGSDLPKYVLIMQAIITGTWNSKMSALENSKLYWDHCYFKRTQAGDGDQLK